MKILVTPNSLKPDTDIPAMVKLRSFADSLVFNPGAKPLSEDALIPLLLCAFASPREVFWDIFF
jgi:hypothetical protein